MNTDTNARIGALKSASSGHTGSPPTPPGTVTPAATPKPDDPYDLVPLLINLAAKLDLAAREAHQAANDAKAATTRIERALPTACAQSIRAELMAWRAQAAEARAKAASGETQPIRVDATKRDLRPVLIFIGVCIAAVIIGIFVQRLW